MGQGVSKVREAPLAAETGRQRVLTLHEFQPAYSKSAANLIKLVYATADAEKQLGLDTPSPKILCFFLFFFFFPESGGWK